MKIARVRRQHWIAGVMLVLISGIAAAQAFPTKPIRFLVPFGPGGIGDLTARILRDFTQVATLASFDLVIISGYSRRDQLSAQSIAFGFSTNQGR